MANNLTVITDSLVHRSVHYLNTEIAIEPFVKVAKIVADLGLGLNAGHDLNLQNLKFFNQSIPNLREVSIGHALISDALYLGLELTILKYKECLR